MNKVLWLKLSIVYGRNNMVAADYALLAGVAAEDTLFGGAALAVAEVAVLAGVGVALAVAEVAVLAGAGVALASGG